LEQFAASPPDGSFGTAEEVGEVGDAAVSQFGRFDGGIATAVAFGEGSEEEAHRLLDVLGVVGERHDGERLCVWMILSVCQHRRQLSKNGAQ
jgi:hypothetical protein